MIILFSNIYIKLLTVESVGNPDAIFLVKFIKKIYTIVFTKVLLRKIIVIIRNKNGKWKFFSDIKNYIKILKLIILFIHF